MDDSWAAYARIQSLADSAHLTDRTRAAEEAAETILDMIQRGQTISPQQEDNLLINRAKTQRHRRKLLAANDDGRHELCAIAADQNGRLEARSELGRCKGQCGDREWRVLVSVGLGHTYGSIAHVEEVPEATLKTWVRRARLKLAA